MVVREITQARMPVRGSDVKNEQKESEPHIEMETM